MFYFVILLFSLLEKLKNDVLIEVINKYKYNLTHFLRYKLKFDIVELK